MAEYRTPGHSYRRPGADRPTSNKSEFDDLFASLPNPFVMLGEMIKGAPLWMKFLMFLPVMVVLGVITAIIVGLVVLL